MKSVLITAVMICALFNYVKSRMCGIDFLKTPKRTLISQENDNKRNLKEEEWKPIRVHLDYSFIENNIGLFNKTDINDLKERIMPKTKEVLEKIIKVKQIPGKLKLLSPTCDEITIPDLYQENGDGVDADIVIFVQIDHTGFFVQNRIEAAAVHCLQEGRTRRPIAGYITFKPNLGVKNSTAVDYMVWLALHEITHVLVFNDALYEDFVDADLKQLGLEKVVGNKTLPNGKIMSFLKTPMIIDKGSKHFGCKKLEGLPLEYNGGPGTVGAHWSKKYLNTDYMIGDSYGENLISEMTLALFEDSGWYKVDYEMSNLFLWGKNKGCSFFDTNYKCVNQEKGKIISNFEPEFCTKSNYPICSTSNIFRGNCKVRKYQNNLSLNERYFEDAQLGGVDMLTDKCPIPVENRNKQNYYGGSCRVGTTNNISKIEKVCPECACFMSNLREEKPKSFLRFKQEPALKTETEIPKGPFIQMDLPILKEEDVVATCYDFKCVESDMFVIVNGKEYKCDEKGSISVSGYIGSITCPPKEVLCHKKFKCKFGCVESYDNNNGFKKYDD